MELHPGLNVFFGRNAQGKTSLLEAVGLVARGRSFRTDDAPSMIRRGAEGLVARADAGEEAGTYALEVALQPGRRAFRVDGRDVAPREYHGRLEVVVYSTDRLRVVKGSMRDRRQFLDRSAAALWPSYRGDLREFERVLLQRNAALEARRRDEDAWTERFLECGARLRHRRGAYAARLTEALASGFRPGGESYEVLVPAGGGSEQDGRRRAGGGDRGRPAARAGGGAQPRRAAPRRGRPAPRRAGRGGRAPPRARPAASCSPSRSRACGSTTRRPAARRWRSSTTSTPSSTRSARAPCARRSRAGGRPWSRAHTRPGRRA